MKISFFMLTTVFLFSSCSTLKDWGNKAMFWKKADEEVVEEDPEKAAAVLHVEKDGDFVDGLTPKEMELKQAKMWARMDEIQNELRMHRARIKVLEKGMKLGIVPDELLTGQYKIEQEPVRRIKKSSAKPKPSSKSQKVAMMNLREDKMQKQGSEEDYRKLFTEGESHFRAGHYGKAIAAFERIGRDFKAFDKNNSHRFWVALSWYKLKDLQVSKDEFDSFIKGAAGSPWIPRAKYYSAKIQFELGMTKTALESFQNLVKTYPYDDTSEMAKMEIERIERSL